MPDGLPSTRQHLHASSTARRNAERPPRDPTRGSVNLLVRLLVHEDDLRSRRRRGTGRSSPPVWTRGELLARAEGLVHDGARARRSSASYARRRRPCRASRAGTRRSARRRPSTSMCMPLRNWFVVTISATAAAASASCEPTVTQTPSVTGVSTSGPSSATTTRSSMRTPPRPGEVDAGLDGDDVAGHERRSPTSRR